MKKKFIVGIIVCSAICLIIYLMTRSSLELEVARAGRGSVSEFIAEDSKTRLAQKYTIGMPIEGRVLRIDLEVGDHVEKDQIVARIDPYSIMQRLEGLKAELKEISARITGVDEAKPKSEDIDAARLRVEVSKLKLENARRDLEIAQIDYTIQKRDYDRIDKLWKDNAIAQSVYDKADQLYKSSQERLEQAKIQSAVASRDLELNEAVYKRVLNSVDDNEYQREVYLAQIEKTKSEINILQDNLSKTQISSPVSGPVIEKFVEDELVLQPGTPLLAVGDLNSIEIEADILSEEIPRVRVGQEVEISGKALGGNSVKGRVKTIYPSGFKKISSLGIEQQRIKTLISFDNSDPGLRPGVSLDVKIIVAKAHDVLHVPEKAVFRHSGTWAVFVIRNNRAYIQEIKTGLKNTDYVEVTEGLAKDQIFVLNPPNALKPGMKVKPVYK